MRLKPSIFIVLASILSGMYASGQTPSEIPFCNRKWYCEMTKDAEGNPHLADSSTAKDYMDFRCDSSFTLSEQGIILKGKWSFDPVTMTITLTQNQIQTIPEHIKFHVIEYDGEKLVIIGQEGTNNEETAFLYTK